jgi:hypothetical protein
MGVMRGLRSILYISEEKFAYWWFLRIALPHLISRLSEKFW